MDFLGLDLHLEVTIKVCILTLHLFHFLFAGNLQKWEDLTDLLALHNFKQVIFNKIAIIVLVQLENIFEYNFEGIVCIHFEASYDLGLKAEVLAYHEVITNFKFWILQDLISNRVILDEHVYDWSSDLFGSYIIIEKCILFDFC